MLLNSLISRLYINVKVQEQQIDEFTCEKGERNLPPLLSDHVKTVI